MTLRDLLRDIVSELDADGGGFRTNEAANLLYAKASEGRGDIPGLGIEQVGGLVGAEAAAIRVEFRDDIAEKITQRHVRVPVPGC